MECRNKINKAGRPKGVVKDPNRLKIKNPNGHKIDVDGVQYNKFIRQGYEVSNDRTELILPKNVVPKVFKVGRPKGIKNKVQKSHIIVNKNEKVVNPDTKRLIKTNGMTFKNINKKYYYNLEKNEFHKFEIRESNSAVRGFAKQHIIDGINGIDPGSFLKNIQSQVVVHIRKNPQTKINLVLWCIMERSDINSGKVITEKKHFVSKTDVLLAGTNVKELYKNAVDTILEKIAVFQQHGSSWRFISIQHLEINSVIYKPLRGSSYIPLPKILYNKKAIINMKNEDNECFKWCIARNLNPV